VHNGEQPGFAQRALPAAGGVLREVFSTPATRSSTHSRVAAPRWLRPRARPRGLRLRDLAGVLRCDLAAHRGLAGVEPVSQLLARPSPRSLPSAGFRTSRSTIRGCETRAAFSITRRAVLWKPQGQLSLFVFHSDATPNRAVAGRRLIPYIRNARTHSDAQVAQVAVPSPSLGL